MSEHNTNPYQQRINRLCDYILQNLDEEHNLEKLSNIAAFSKFHFHRVFAAHTGMTVVKFIQLSRLKRASYRLAFEKHLSIIDIGFEAGFNSAESFTRAFKRELSQTPSQFRAQPKWVDWHAHFNVIHQHKMNPIMNVEIVEFPETKIAYISHIGAPNRVFETVATFIAWRKASGLSPLATSKTFGIPHSDPNTTPANEFRWDVCGSIQGDIPPNDYGVRAGTIPAGKCALVRHLGSHALLENTIYQIYQQWLPQNACEPRDYPCFFHYLNFIHQVDECDLITDIYVPIQDVQC